MGTASSSLSLLLVKAAVQALPVELRAGEQFALHANVLPVKLLFAELLLLLLLLVEWLLLLLLEELELPLSPF